MKKEPVKYTTLKLNQTFMQSLCSTAASVAGTGFLIYVSQGSTWWTLVTGLMFLMIFFGRCAVILKNNQAEFYTKAEVVKWANSLPDDEEEGK